MGILACATLPHHQMFGKFIAGLFLVINRHNKRQHEDITYIMSGESEYFARGTKATGRCAWRDSIPAWSVELMMNQ
jgi:hypothetical protein